MTAEPLTPPQRVRTYFRGLRDRVGALVDLARGGELDGDLDGAIRETEGLGHDIEGILEEVGTLYETLYERKGL